MEKFTAIVYEVGNCIKGEMSDMSDTISVG